MAEEAARLAAQQAFEAATIEGYDANEMRIVQALGSSSSTKTTADGHNNNIETVDPAAAAAQAALEQFQQQQQQQQHDFPDESISQLLFLESAAAAVGNTHSGQEQLLEQLMGVSSDQPNGPERNDDVSAEALMNLMIQQQQASLPPEHVHVPPLQQQPTPPVVAIPMPPPLKHYFTVSQEGVILEATTTVTGFPPEAVLMKSITDTMFEEDLPVFLWTKRKFWDRGHVGVATWIRRRTLQGQWLWLLSRVVDYVGLPGAVAPLILEEATVLNVEEAREKNRAMRIVALLAHAVEASWLVEDAKSKQETSLSTTAAASLRNNNNNGGLKQQQQILESQELKGALAAIQATGLELPRNQEDLEFLGVKDKDTNEQESGSASFDPNAILESIREGVRLDLGTSNLTENELKAISFVLAGRIRRDVVIEMAEAAFRNGEGIEAYDDQFQNYPDNAGKSNSHIITDKKSLRHVQLLRGCSPAPPPICVLNLSYCYIGNSGMDILSEVLYQEGSKLKSLDVSFCSLDEKGIVTLAKALSKRKRRRIPSLKGLILSGNIITDRGASELGTALAPQQSLRPRKRPRVVPSAGGYDSESEDDDDDDDDEDVPSLSKDSRKEKLELSEGLALLHVANASMKPNAVSLLLQNIGVNCTIRELNLASNYFGLEGVSAVVQSLDPKRGRSPALVMPFLDRLDLSNNNLADDGTTEFTRVIPKRRNMHFVQLKLSSNSIGPDGIQTMMDRLLHQNIVSLSLDKNSICDQGCQLVAASLQSMKSLARLNLGFNKIGGRGISSLMRSLVSCKSITYLGLSGNVLRVSGAIALSYVLSQHPRIEELDLDNCCLGQAAQCHIVAGIISNRWVPMKKMGGFVVAPPMVAIGALPPESGRASNSECFRMRKDEQMKTMLQWIASNKGVKRESQPKPSFLLDSQPARFLSPEHVTEALHGTPSQSAYLRMLGWLSRIPFDDDELASLQKFFYDIEGGDGDGGNDGPVNLKLRGDLLAALDASDANEIREEGLLPNIKNGSIGLDLDQLEGKIEWNAREAVQGKIWDPTPEPVEDEKQVCDMSDAEALGEGLASAEEATKKGDEDQMELTHCSSTSSMKERRSGKVKPRITLFPLYEQQLEELKKQAGDLIDGEEDLHQQHIILTQYAEASLSILRQLRYHCMNSGFDGWPQSGQTRKILVVDDSQVARKLVSRAFEKANYIVDTACNGAEGVEKMKASIYDIAFMDIDMPVMNGFEATKNLREWEDAMRPGARQPICALTATYVDDFERSELMKFRDAGLDVMESKPCNIPRLFKVVDDVAPMFSELNINLMQRVHSSDQSMPSTGTPTCSTTSNVSW